MMKSKQISKIKIAIIIPVAAISIFFFSCNEESEDMQEVAKTEHAKESEVITNSQKSVSDEISSEEEVIIAEEADELVYYKSEVMPKFQGKPSDEFRFYIQEQLQYPAQAQKNGEQGRVFVAFSVDQEGKVVDVEVVRGVSESLDKEALRVVNGSPKWEAGLIDDEPVKVRFTFPIVFKIK